MSSVPPYGSTNLVEVQSKRSRQYFITLFQCQETGWYYARHANGNYYPLTDRTDVESDVILRVIDGSRFED